MARTHLHVALGAIFLVCFAPFVSWLLFLRHLHDPPGPWRRRLLAIAIIDTVLVAALVAAGSQGAGMGPAPPSLPRIGIVLDQTEPKAVRVAAVVPSGPADQAGLEVGDRILSIDGQPVPRNDAVATMIGSTPRGASRRLVLARGAEQREVTVVPVEGLRNPPAPRVPLFEPIKGADASDLTQQIRTGLAEIVMVGVVCAFARRRRASSLLGGLGLLPALIASTLAALLTIEVFRRTIGLSLGASLCSLIAGTTTLLVAGLVLRRGIGPVPGANEAAEPSASTLGTIALGVLYGVAGVLRLGIVLLLLFPKQMLATESARNIGPYLSWGPSGIALTILAVAVLAPIGEEILFRGVLLPWLTTWSRPMTAMIVSATVFAIGHLHYGVGAAIIFIYGLVLGWARLRTGNLRASIALHMILNTTVCVASLVRS